MPSHPEPILVLVEVCQTLVCAGASQAVGQLELAPRLGVALRPVEVRSVGVADEGVVGSELDRALETGLGRASPPDTAETRSAQVASTNPSSGMRRAAASYEHDGRRFSARVRAEAKEIVRSS